MSGLEKNVLCTRNGKPVGKAAGPKKGKLTKKEKRLAKRTRKIMSKIAESELDADEIMEQLEEKGESALPENLRTMQPPKEEDASKFV